MTPTAIPAFLPLRGVRILSLALNLPGPAALMRLRRMGADCLKLEPPGGDPMGSYNQAAYDQLHEGIAVRKADLKTAEGQEVLHHELAQTDVLLTSFRPSAFKKLGIAWETLHARYPTLSQVAIVGSPGGRAEEPGHDLTYLAEKGLVPGLELPATLYADMGGSLMATEAVLQACLLRHSADGAVNAAHGMFIEVALSVAAGYLALPRQWGLTQPEGWIGGAHAGYRVYACKDGRVAMAALEPHFAAALCTAAGMASCDIRTLLTPASRQHIADFLLTQTRRELDALAVAKDIPLHTMR
ncbi:CoA transferase [Polaromonas sp.]|uniref:CoA transferase n=1 Tax=Polaromonas sp. TaxID=1869339 RepID=UPI0013BD7229|nr:CoA transferase [Polaromonas sp.]NDP62192.1 CoA transferase [Polaromonas sp.]